MLGRGKYPVCARAGVSNSALFELESEQGELRTEPYPVLSEFGKQELSLLAAMNGTAQLAFTELSRFCARRQSKCGRTETSLIC